jgi:hypothetical protein
MLPARIIIVGSGCGDSCMPWEHVLLAIGGGFLIAILIVAVMYVATSIRR